MTNRAPNKHARAHSAADKPPSTCAWPGLNDPDYTRYHDEEWGLPKTTDRALFEKIILEGFQAGLSWLTILRKRDNFRTAFDNFDPARIANYGPADMERLLSDAGIVRNRAKIEAAVINAQAYLHLRDRISLLDFLWQFLDYTPIINMPKVMGDLPAQTPLSAEISKALKAEGFRFVGPTTTYAFLQSCGFVNDHLIGCHRHAPCTKIQRDFAKSITPSAQ